jgi:uncharacterized SAM-dependent methyltransferase
VTAFEHRAIWVAEHGRIEMHLISRCDQTVHFGTQQIEFRRGESLRTEYSHKYTLERFAAMASKSELTVAQVWMDEQRWFSVQLLQASAG